MPYSYNYLLNPLHEAFDDIEIGQAEPFPVDERLIPPDTPTRQVSNRRLGEEGQARSRPGSPFPASGCAAQLTIKLAQKQTRRYGPRRGRPLDHV